MEIVCKVQTPGNDTRFFQVFCDDLNLSLCVSTLWSKRMSKFVLTRQRNWFERKFQQLSKLFSGENQTVSSINQDIKKRQNINNIISTFDKSRPYLWREVHWFAVTINKSYRKTQEWKGAMHHNELKELTKVISTFIKSAEEKNSEPFSEAFCDILLRGNQI